MADLSAKDGSQETMVNLLALLVNLWMLPKIANYPGTRCPTNYSSTGCPTNYPGTGCPTNYPGTGCPINYPDTWGTGCPWLCIFLLHFIQLEIIFEGKNQRERKEIKIRGTWVLLLFLFKFLYSVYWLTPPVQCHPIPIICNRFSISFFGGAGGVGLRENNVVPINPFYWGLSNTHFHFSLNYS